MKGVSPMLTKLRIENYLSFKESTTIDLRVTGYKVLNKTNVYDETLKGSFFVGANASGKTNVIRGLKALFDLLFAEKVISLNSSRCLFSGKSCIELEYDFIISKAKINYLIQYDVTEKSLIEKLYLNGRIVLNRIGSNAESEITDNKRYTDIDQNTLLLREIYFNTKFRSSKILREWFEFLLNSVYLDGYKEIVFSPGKHSLDLEDYVSKQGVELINDFFEGFNFNQRIEYSKISLGNLTSIESLEEEDIFFKREGVGEPIPFPMESLGNQKLLRFLPSFFHVVQNGGLLIIDEFSSGFHNFLEELLIKYFMKNSRNSQLFIVSHSTNLLSNAVLRPDQIYAVEFKGIRGSHVKRFSTEQPRVAQNIEKMYTGGVFGGIPHFGDEDDKIK
jgi:AAA15 family ATPase/GTPase